MTEKVCKWCLQTKPLEAFTKIKSFVDGRANKCKVCTNTANLSSARAYKEKNANDIRKRDRDKYHADIEAARAKNRAKHHANKDGRSATAKAYAKANAEKRRAWARAWAAANPDYNKQKLARKRQSLKNLDELDRFALDEAAKLCAVRQVMLGGTWEIDHIVPVSKGGTSEHYNIQVVPKTWNASKGNRNCDKFLG